MLISQVLYHLQMFRRLVGRLSNHLFNRRTQLARKQESLIINLSALDLILDNKTKDRQIIILQMKKSHLSRFLM